jgi:hypothetical protein
MNDIIHNIDMLKAIYRPRKLLPLLEKMIDPNIFIPSRNSSLKNNTGIYIKPNTENVKIILKIYYIYNKICKNEQAMYIRTRCHISLNQELLKTIKEICHYILCYSICAYIDNIVLDKSYYKYINTFINGLIYYNKCFGWREEEIKLIYKHKQYLDNIDNILIDTFSKCIIYREDYAAIGLVFVMADVDIIQKFCFHMKTLRIYPFSNNNKSEVNMKKLNFIDIINQVGILYAPNQNYNIICNIGTIWKSDKKNQNKILL